MITLAATLGVILVGVGVFVYCQIQQEELVSYLRQYGAYDARFKYEPLTVIDVDSLPKPAGNLSIEKLILVYEFHPPDQLDNVSYLWLTYAAAPPCNSNGIPPSSSCEQRLIIIPNNNVTPPNMQHALYANPLNSFGFELYTARGQHIEWHLYLFLATYNPTNNEQ